MCCQGYANYCCFKAGMIGDTGNPVCMACESCCCPGLAVSSTRMYVMDKYDLQSDPCDRRILHCSNCLQLLACVCHILAIVQPEFRDLAALIDCIADLVFLTVMGCMNAQVDLELKKRMGAVAPGGPVCAEEMYHIEAPVGPEVEAVAEAAAMADRESEADPGEKAL